MSATINIIETTTELGVEVVEVVVASSSTPGPAGPGVPTGGTDGQVLTKTSGTDYATAWEDPTGGGGGAPTTVDYLVGTASGDLSAEIVVGTSPGGELGGTWASPTVDATHSGSSHAAVQAAAEATAAGALSSHEADTTNIHGIADTSVLATDTEVATAVSDHSSDTTSVHGIADTSALALTANAVMDGDTAGGVLGGTYPNPSFAADMATQAELDAHINDSSDAHDASAISIADAGNDFTATDVEGALAELQSDHETDETNLANHIADSSDAHDASAISVADSGGLYTATEVEAVLQEIGAIQTYTPAWTSAGTQPTLVNGTITGRYHKIGSRIHYAIVLTMGSSTTYGTGSYFLSLPAAAASLITSLPIGIITALNAGIASYGGFAIMQTTTTVLLATTASPQTAMSPTVPFTFGTGDAILVTGSYESA